MLENPKVVNTLKGGSSSPMQPLLQEVSAALSQDPELLAEFTKKLNNRLYPAFRPNDNTGNLFAQMLAGLQSQAARMAQMVHAAQMAQSVPGPFLHGSASPHVTSSLASNSNYMPGSLHGMPPGLGYPDDPNAPGTIDSPVAPPGQTLAKGGTAGPAGGFLVIVQRLPEEWGVEEVQKALQDTGFICGQDFREQIEIRQDRARVFFNRRLCAKALCRLLPSKANPGESRGPWPAGAVATSTF